MREFLVENARVPLRCYFRGGFDDRVQHAGDASSFIPMGL